ncbi:hypothetical protein CAMRE0001_3045 [Campylobacter rectus RM3267]|uniref:Uncharacterized protein n=1 Tax=Campylobacter rectus RM3267 TaxID=553218 RepID=B9D4F7_CAMRE|nr:hypothetical protein CAMRE0001_3045 [Campylobacter rectus RM3267]
MSRVDAGVTSSLNFTRARGFDRCEAAAFCAVDRQLDKKIVWIWGEKRWMV